MIKHPINCKCTHRKLAMIDKDALYIMCRSCKTEQSISREEVNRVWSQLDEHYSEQEASTSEQRVLY